MATASSSAGRSVKSIYRSLLKAVDKQITAVTGDRKWRTFVIEQFRASSQHPLSQEATQGQLQLAHDYTFYVNNIAHHKELLLTYNIGLEEDERTKKMVEAVARRVGFQLPKPGEARPKGKPSNKS